MEEKLIIKLETLKAETLGELNILFRQKIQFEEQCKENEVQIQYKRGIMMAFTEFQKLIKEIHEGEQIEAMRAQEMETVKHLRGSNKEGILEEIPA